MLLAATSGEVFKQEAQQYSPLLAAQQPGARLIAARTLHEVFGAKMLPWLIGGESGRLVLQATQAAQVSVHSVGVPAGRGAVWPVFVEPVNADHSMHGRQPDRRPSARP